MSLSPFAQEPGETPSLPLPDAPPPRRNGGPNGHHGGSGHRSNGHGHWSHDRYPAPSDPDLLRPFLSRLDGVKQHGERYQARCPAHDDRNASLSLTCKDGRVLLNCHAGCHFSVILTQLGLTKKDLFTPDTDRREKRDKGQEPPKKRIVQTYDYHDAGGRLLFQVCRQEPKGFIQRRSDGKGGWVWNLKGLEPVLYHLPEVLAAARQGGTVYVVEGEKDADRLRKLGLTATTSPMGAGKWRSGFVTALSGAEVVILPDNDGPGFSHADQIAESTHPVARCLKICRLPNLPPKADVSDWLDRGHTVDELRDLVRGTPPWEPPGDEDGDGGGGEGPYRFSCTDLGNAERLVARHGHDLRFSPQTEGWMVWDGSHWRVDGDGEIMRRAIETIRSINQDLKSERDADLRNLLAKHVTTSEKAQRLEATIKLAKSQPGIPIKASDLDRDPWLINVQNGTLDMRTGDLREHRREDLITHVLPLEYHPDAPCPLWEAFVKKAMGGDPEMVAFLQRAIGYSLTGSTREQCLFLHWGKGSNGKSTMLETLRSMLGPYSMTANFQTFLDCGNQRTGNREDLADLKGKRLVTASEAGEGRRLDEAVIKSVTGGDTIRASRKYQHDIEFTPLFKLHLAANHRPLIRGNDLGIWRRIRLVPWNVTVREGEKDPDLPAKLRGELAGILAWSVRGARAWNEGGLRPPKPVLMATEDYRGEMDTLTVFIGDMCVKHPDARTNGKQLYLRYQEWCEEMGERPFKRREFDERMDGQEDVERRLHHHALTWAGIGLKDEAGLQAPPAAAPAATQRLF